MQRRQIVQGSLALALTGCGGGGGSSPAPSPSPAPAPAPTPAPAPATPTVIPALKDLADFPIGMEVAAADEERSIFKLSAQLPTINKHFNSLVAGVIMKMSYLHPEEKRFFYTDADALTAYARDHGMHMHGHTLIWHWDTQVPTWMVNYTGDWKAMMDDHVSQICQHFAGSVQSWDVVNEALDESTSHGWRETIFYKKLGKAYVENAFRAARAADPKAELYYNEYNMEASDAKLKFMLAMIDDFQARGVPLDGIGFQMHTNITTEYPPIEQIQAAFKAVAMRGLKVRISELDMYTNLYGTDKTLTDAVAEAQKLRYKAIVKAYLAAVPPAQRTGITFWGLVDGESWMNHIGNPFSNWPLLFNDDYTPKPAFWGVVEALQGK